MLSLAKKWPNHCGEKWPDQLIEYRGSRETRETPQRNPPRSSGRVLADIPERTTWRDYEEMRRVIRKPLTRRARELAIEQLAQLRTDGHDPKLVLRTIDLSLLGGIFATRRKRKWKRFLSDRSSSRPAPGRSCGLDPRVVEAALSKRPS